MKKQVFVSDLTGNEITTHALIRILIGNDMYVIDANADEEQVVALTAVGTKVAKRGRKKKNAAA